jgi:hypothetical protein
MKKVIVIYNGITRVKPLSEIYMWKEKFVVNEVVNIFDNYVTGWIRGKFVERPWQPQGNR